MSENINLQGDRMQSRFLNLYLLYIYHFCLKWVITWDLTNVSTDKKLES